MNAQIKSETMERQYLNDLRKRRMSVAVYLVSGVKQSGTIESFDQHTVLLRQGSSTQLIYKHMISSVMPALKSVSTSTSPPTQRVDRRATATATTTAAPKVTLRAPRRIVKPGE